MKKLIKTLYIVLLICSCQDGRQKGNNVSFTEVETSEKKEDESLQIIDSVTYLKLQETAGAHFVTINKLVILEDRIYIFDKLGNNVLLAFDHLGHFVCQYGKHGNANNEYIRLSDFDVDSHNVYLYDRAKQKMLTFDLNGNFIQSISTSFRGECFKVLENGEYLFALAQNESLCKLCVTDSALNIVNPLLTFDRGDKDDKMTDNLFRTTGDKILFHKPINDSLYILSKEGRIEGGYYFDFGESQVPNKMRLSYSDFVEQGGLQKYTHIYECPFIVSNIIVAPCFHNSSMANLIYRLSDKSWKFMPFKEGLEEVDIIHPCFQTSKTLIGWMDDYAYEMLSNHNTIPQDIATHIHDGGRVLIKYHIKD